MTQTAEAASAAPLNAVESEAEHEMSDSELAAKIRETVGLLNHWCHVAAYRGLSVYPSWHADGPLMKISEVLITRRVFDHGARP